MTAISMPRLSESAVRLFAEPFRYGYVDRYLPEDVYRRLARDFIDPATHASGGAMSRGKKRIKFQAPPVPQEIARAAPAWGEAIASIVSRDFLADCWTWLGAHAPASLQPEGPYRTMMDARLKIDPGRLAMVCEFSSLGNGALLPPHSDSPDKCISFILYFAPEEWHSAWGGATEIYEPHDPRHDFNWSNTFLPLTAMKTAFRCEFVPNRLFFFVKGYNAWHGVTPVAAPNGETRRSFNFSLAIPRTILAQSPHAELQAEIYRSEAAIYGR
jgi:hypothetical protein